MFSFRWYEAQNTFIAGLRPDGFMSDLWLEPAALSLVHTKDIYILFFKSIHQDANRIAQFNCSLVICELY